ncbi:MAG: DNA polymerase III subunit epsilon [Alphaproteobacteria bacterium]|nr:DNA polymerase III subunit epsilon [Alphaproteobacteria bacterium]
MREIVLDTETTGLNPANGDRIVDIACVELINHIQTGNVYQTYINPKKLMDEEALRITGITNDFLKDKPLFEDVADEFLDFVRDSTLVIHNARFDIDFLNSELSRIDKPLFKLEDAVDTLTLAKIKFPGSAVNLDALCRKFEIDTSIRVTHGALVDCYLLADVYLNLLGGRQSSLLFESEHTQSNSEKINSRRTFHEARKFLPTDEEIEIHETFLKTLNNAQWHSFFKENAD